MEVLASAPDMDPTLHWVWRAWWRLHLDRPWIVAGMGGAVPRPIPWATVRAWCDRQGLNDAEAGFMDACFRAMDAAFIEHHAQQAKASAKP